MHIQSRSTRDEIAVNTVLISRPFELEGADVQRVGRADPIPSNAVLLVRPPQLSRAEQTAIAYRSRSNRLAVICHEMRNSLGVVRNAARLLVMPETLAGATDTARLVIERQIGQMSMLVEDLLDGSRITAPRSLQRERIDLRVLIKQVIEGITSDFDRRGHRLTINLPDYPVWLDADPARIEQVFANLLMNAAKYTHNGGDITLTVQRQLEYANVRIRDSGIGIAAEALPCVFGLFFQAEPSASDSKTGRGIGLAVVRNFVEMHGGRVTAASAGLGRGSEFTVLLPASRI